MPGHKAIPPCPSPPQVRNQPGLTRTYSIHLLTPLFGGGVEAKMQDPVTLIRGTEIRGQLEFWWRATRGAALSTVAELQNRHAEVWGSTARSSPVVLEVADIQGSPPQPCARIVWNSQARQGAGAWGINWQPPCHGNDLRYFLFPFQGELPPNRRDALPREEPANCVTKASFSLKLCFPASLQDDVEMAVWAWANFGGLGARTRRGCGALLCPELAPANPAALKTWLGQHSLVTTESRAWPILSGSIYYLPQVGSPLDTWNRLASQYKHFRQGVDFARNRGQGPRPGRSRFPEPESIREATNMRASIHSRLSHIPTDAFPRAELGLPILFQYQGQGEPPKTTLLARYQDKRKDRMASPIILKPLGLANGQTVAIIVRLITPPLKEIELMEGSDSHGVWGEEAIRSPHFANYTNSPLAGSPNGSALEAFLDYAVHQHDFVEVHG